ncbi:NAD-dependent epimerase/dehydratase family protein [Rhodoferax sp.]|uniref:NAD-dependent epimerase/dehydratase family protein n=1 Tax=Rhodoferax sp. TaxID=50421 RepID=UPI002849B886|nr:NAD-dependent epimerase/dehydratase family protein [Rhodoferax sp.]MDR3371649.1 NAD-dependent epimerase/dehydratase family protein [Rhodoferax sp.]
MSRDGVLLLGGGGFIGSALAKRLRLDGVPIYVVGRDNGDAMGDMLPRCGTVVHLASGTTPGSSARYPMLEEQNLALTLHLLELIQTQSPMHLIFFSSGGTVYGNPATFPVAEDSPLAPLSYHGAGKAAQEILCKTLTTLGHTVTVLRPSNAYGPGQTMRHGFGLIRTMLQHAQASSTLEIWGDGENVRDYIYIDDVVEATLRLIGLPDDCGTYNLGSGVGHSINQVKDVVETTCCTVLDTVYRPSRGMDVRSVVLDNTRLRATLTWQPTVGLADGIVRTWESIQNP